jgi:DNA-binding NarL/FixJ family response regulator
MTHPFRGDGRPVREDRTAQEFPDPSILAEFGGNYSLTPRERQILALICRSMKNAQIAGELGVTNATIRLHIGNIHRKLSTDSKVDLVLKLWRWFEKTDSRAP